MPKGQASSPEWRRAKWRGGGWSGGEEESQRGEGEAGLGKAGAAPVLGDPGRGRSIGYRMLSFSASAAAQLRLQRPIWMAWRVLCGELAELESGRDVSFIPEDSIASAYSEQLREWLPEASKARLIARHEGRDAASVDAFIDAAEGRAKTLTFVETEDRCSICEGYLGVAWVEDDYANDPNRKSFLFTLKNHLGVPPTRLAQQRGEPRAFMVRGGCFWFCDGEGFMARQDDWVRWSGRTYKAPDQSGALFNGDDGGVFRVGPV
jgi:hypothetical protein